MRSGRRRISLVLPEQVITEARRHLPHAGQQAAFDAFLEDCQYEEISMPSAQRVKQNLDLVRSAKDVPIALALLDGMVEVFVTNDRDFTEPSATAPRFHDGVQILLAAVFLRDVLGWAPEDLEAIRNRQWSELSP